MVHQGSTENQVRTPTGTIVAIESEWRSGKRKGLTERHFQIESICSTQGILNFFPSALCKIFLLSAYLAAKRVRSRNIPQ